MTRFLTAAAVVAMTSTSAIALTEAEEMKIKRFVPNADLSLYDDATISSVMNAITAGDSFADKQGKVRSLLMFDRPADLAKLTEGQKVLIERYVDEGRIATMTQAEKRAVLNVVSSSESEADKRGSIDALLMRDTAGYAGNDATMGEVVLIKSYAPEIEVSALTQTEVDRILQIINNTESEGAVSTRIDAFLSS